MDLTAIKVAKDEDLQAFGLVRRGDILALRAFAEQGGEAANIQRSDKKRKLLEILKEKLPRKKNMSKKVENPPKEFHPKIANRKVHIGWQHFDNQKNRYVSVRMSRGGGSREISVPILSTRNELISQMELMFFPDGKSVFGDISTMRVSLGNFKCDEVLDQDFTLSKYISRHKLSKVRLYLLTKSEEGRIISVFESDEEFPPAFDSPCDNPDGTTSLIGSSVERSSLRMQQDVEFAESLDKDQEKDIKKMEELKMVQEKEMKDESLLQARAANVPREPDLNEPHVKVSVRHLTLGVQVRRFPHSCQISTIYNWVGSLSLHPVHFTLSTCHMPNLDPNLPISLVDRTLVNMAASDEATMFPELTEDHWLIDNFQHDSNGITNVTEFPPEVLLEEDEL